MKNIMRIAMIIDAWDPIVWWGQIHVYNLCKKLIENHGCQIDLFVRAVQWDNKKIYTKDESLFHGKLRILRCGRPKMFFNIFERILSIFSISFRIIKEHKKQKYDVVHAHAFLWLLSGKLASFFLKLPIVATVHWANLLDKWKKSLFYFVEKTLLTKIRYTTLISVGSSFLKYPNANKNIVIIPNWVNVEEFDTVQHQQKKDIFKILFVWRLEWTKGINVLIKAIKLLYDGHKKLLLDKHAEFHLIGYWYQEEEYRQLVDFYWLGNLVIFRGLITWNDLIKEYKESSLFVLPSITEGFGITILEAMVSKVLVIATKSWWPQDIIQNGKNGFLVKPWDEKALAEIIAKCIEKWVDNIILNNALSTVKNNFTRDIVAEKVYQQYILL